MRFPLAPFLFLTFLLCSTTVLATPAPQLSAIGDLIDTLKGLSTLLDGPTLAEADSLIHYGSVLLDSSTTPQAKTLITNANSLLTSNTTTSVLAGAASLLTASNVADIKNLIKSVRSILSDTELLIEVRGLLSNGAKLLEGDTVAEAKNVISAANASLPLLAKFLGGLGGS